jgi:hypothetical protein
MISAYLERWQSVTACAKSFNDQQILSYSISPQGVGWNSIQAQEVRLMQLLHVLPRSHNEPLVINDIGCGYGALLQSLRVAHKNFIYRGYDISDKMLEAAKLINAPYDSSTTEFSHLSRIRIADYVVASGIFGLRYSFSDSAWHEYILQTLDIMNYYSTHGFAFNMLTSYSDKDKKKDELYYADPCRYFDICKLRYSRNVALLHDYTLYDFTIIVRKNNDV